MPDWNPNRGTHPDLETLSAYVDGVLVERAKADVETHLAFCEPCLDLVTDVMSTSGSLAGEDEHGSVRGPRPLPRRPWVQAAAILGTLAATLLVAVQLRERSQPDPLSAAVAPLVDAVGDERLLEPRLTGGFRFGPRRANVRGGGEDNLALLAAAGRLQQSARQVDDASTQQAWAMAELLLGRHDNAVATLEYLVQREGADARAWTNLSAAYLARAADLDRPDDLPKALDAVEHALTADPGLVEARFNKGLALRALAMRDGAVAAFREYLEVDPDSPWADEARRYLDELAATQSATETELPHLAATGQDVTDRLVATAPLLARDYVDLQLLASLSERLPTAEPFTTELDRLQRVATAFEAIGEDSLHGDLVRWLTLAAAAPAVERQQIARGLADYALGRRLGLEDNIALAHTAFERAYAELRGSPLDLELRYYLTGLAAQQAPTPLALAELDAIASLATLTRRFNVRGLALWRRALMTGRTGDLQTPLAIYAESLDAFDRSGEIEHEANVHSLMAENLRLLGDPSRAWRHHLDALRLISSSPARRIRHQVFGQAAQTAQTLSLHRGALVLQSEVIANAVAWESAAALTIGHYQRAKTLDVLGRTAEAVADLETARRHLQGVSDARMRERTEAELFEVEAQVLARDHPADAESRATMAIQRFRERGLEMRVPRLLVQRARLRARPLPTRAAMDDLAEGIRIVEGQRRQLGAARDSHFDLLAALIREKIRLLSAGDAPQDELLAELDRLSFRKIRDAHADVPAGAQGGHVIRFLVAEDATYVWHLHGEQVTRRQLPVPRWRVELLARTYLRAVAAGRDGRTESAALYETFVNPWIDDVPADALLVVVPDAILNALPFGAMFDRASGAHLLVRNPVIVSASLRPDDEADSAALDGTTRALVVADPARDEPVAGTELPNARAEAAMVARHFASAHLLQGQDATRQAIVDGLAQVRVAHFATHGISNRFVPQQSRLVLAHGQSLVAADIEQLAARDLRLVVLAACRSADTDMPWSESAMPLVTAWLVAGSAQVIASLWDVDDAASAEIMTHFYSALAAGASPVRALRTAQLQYLKTRGADAPARLWSGFSVFTA
jgi:CHAT domain-containing protein/tetratricopeptide (TPR) repeat protein